MKVLGENFSLQIFPSIQNIEHSLLRMSNLSRKDIIFDKFYLTLHPINLGYTALMSCKDSETEHVLSVVPISADIGSTVETCCTLKLWCELMKS